MYASGRGVEQEAKVAAFWYRAAANRGHVAAMRTLSEALRSGTGVAKNEKEAADWQAKADAAPKGGNP
jgi:TPR repeat protein